MNAPQWLALVSVVGGIGGLATAAIWAHVSYRPHTVSHLWAKLALYPFWLSMAWFLIGLALGALMVHLYEAPPGWIKRL